MIASHDWVDPYYVTEYFTKKDNQTDAVFRGKPSSMATTYLVTASLHRTSDDVPIALFIPKLATFVVDKYMEDCDNFVKQFIEVRRVEAEAEGYTTPELAVSQTTMHEWVTKLEDDFA